MNTKFDDLLGKKYNKLTILSLLKTGKKSSSKVIVACMCDCGNMTVRNIRDLLRSKDTIKSCGCARSMPGKLNPAYKHGDRYQNSEYYQLHCIWSYMLKRCRPSKKNPNSQEQQNYYLRGIRVCKEWEDYANFKDWAVNHSNYKLNSDLSIERIDVNGNYCPENCTWIPKNEQSKNRRFCHFITYKVKHIL